MAAILTTPIVLEHLEPDRILEAVEAGDRRGFCVACGTEVAGVPHDARGQSCTSCGEPMVYSTDELLLRLVSF